MLNLAGPFEFAPANHSLQELKSEGGPAEGGPGTSRKPESIRPVGIAAYARLDICSELQLIDYSYPSKYLARPPPAVVLLPDVAMAGTFANGKGFADCHVAGLKMTYFEAMVLPSRVGGGKDLPGGLSTDIHIGMCSANSGPGEWPGTSKGSFALCGKDGCVYHNKVPVTSALPQPDDALPALPVSHPTLPRATCDMRQEIT